jgi:itaconate CoA-transferase
MFLRLTRDESAQGLRAAKTAYGFVNDIAAFAHHPALRRVSVNTPGGPLAVAAPAPRFSDGDRELGPVPALGEHSASVRDEFR